MPEKTEAQKRAQKAYMEKFVRVEIRMNAERRGTIQAHAAARGESVNGFINRAISETMERDAAASPQEASTAALEGRVVSLHSETEKRAPGASESQTEGPL